MEQAAPAATITKRVSISVVSISIIIPALNEEKMIGRCLESLTQLAFAHDRFEVLIVDNGSRDRTLAIAESFKDRLNLKILQQAGVRISALRNLGARAASGNTLAFLDADCLAPADNSDCNTPAGIAASVNTNASRVAISGAIIPEPLAMPLMMTELRPILAVAVASFG